MARVKRISPATEVKPGEAVQDSQGRIGRVVSSEPTEITHRSGYKTPAREVVTEDADGVQTRQAVTPANRWKVFGR